MTEQTKNPEITKRLDAIIRLLVAQLNSKESSGMVQIYQMLRDAGLTTGDIAKLMGKPSKTISGMLVNASQRKSKKNKRAKVTQP